MISNRDTNSNLAKEVQRKKKEMQTQENSEKKRMLIAYSVVGGIAAILIGYAVYKMSGGDNAQATDFVTPETSTDKYNSKLEALEAKQKNHSNTNLLDVFSSKKKDTIVNDSIEENKLKQNLEQYNKPIEQKAKPRVSQNKKDVYGDYSMWEEEEKPSTKKSVRSNSNQELSYEEKVRLAKEARYGNTNTSNTKATASRAETRFAIFRDQFKLPGELAELVLTNDFTFNNKLYKKGTPVYGYININKSRVLFDIQNIAHQPLNIEVRDIRDGLIGMYSSRAGALWKKYEAEGLNDATDEASNSVTGNRILSNSIDALSTFFQKKRLNKNDKIMLLNDQELIVYITEK